MHSYTLTRDAENDLRDIARYTLSKWGNVAFDKYKNGLERAFINISNCNVITKSFSKNLPDIRVTKYKFHFIFYLQKKNKTIIIGVIHEQRDILNNLINRLES